ncbi:hypothetical protein CC86DRAFT_453362 [Ophiobolus disseminans]|uniref:Uncharacterized protein n=1 Tax=Ophiobolus disseminans TaxID=1469910 RepID=A0A6A7A9F7_9PLEO|nr:hypothetical protein CC86DRAFT_453362 [Ophiobolus disseminans]
MTSLMQKLAVAVQDQMQKKLTTANMVSYEIAAPTDPLLEDRVFEVACNIALDLASLLHTSNFHTWEFFRHAKTQEDALQRAPYLQKATYPYATCLDMAMSISSALKAALVQDRDLAAYADRVETATDCKVDVMLTSSRDIHCLTLIRLPNFCIVIDLCAQPTAFKVQLGTAFECQQQLDMLNQNFYSFPYAYVGNVKGARMLVDCSGYTTKTPGDFHFGLCPFHEITDTEYQRFLAFAVSANSGNRVSSVGNLPSRRTIQVRSIWNYEPKNQNITYSPFVDGTYIVNTLALRIDFVRQEMLLAIPYQDWLAKLDYAYYHERLSAYNDFTRCAYHLSDAIAFFKLSLGRKDHFDLPKRGMSTAVHIKLQMLDAVCARLGLPAGEMIRMAHVVYEVWVAALKERNEELNLCQRLLGAHI